MHDLGFAKVDIGRFRRQGVPEVVYGEGKNAAQIGDILSVLRAEGQLPAIATRVDVAKARILKRRLGREFQYFADARLVRLGKARKPDGAGTVAVAAAGTSDIPVAEEAALVAETFGNSVERFYDVGVAGLDSLLSCVDALAPEWKAPLQA